MFDDSSELEKLLPILLVLFVLTVLIYLLYSGLWTGVDVGTKECGHLMGKSGLVVAYKSGRGSYKDSSILYTEAFCVAPDKSTIGIFYDDPDSTPPDELRYAVGSIINDGLAGNNEGELNDNDSQVMAAFIRHGFKIAHFPQPNFAVWATFPFRTTLSIYFAIYKVYPKLKSYITSQSLCAYPAIEIYKSDLIHFLMPLSRQDEFYVPEFSEEQESIATTEVSSNFNAASEKVERQKVINEDDVFVKPKIPKASFSSRSKQSTAEVEVATGNEEIDRSESTSSFENIGEELIEDEAST